jgi:hypothetical protein
MRTFLAACLVLVLIQSATVVAQQMLTELEVQEALQAGARTKPVNIGLVLKPRANLKERLGLEAVRALQNPLEEGPKLWPGFVMVVHTPLSWLRLASARAALRFENVSVSADMKNPVLRVFLKPNSQTSAVLRSTDRQTILRPVGSRGCVEIMHFGDEVSGDCVETQFELDAVRRLQNSHGEFLITVAMMSTAGEVRRDFKVNRGHLRKLPGLAKR